MALATSGWRIVKVVNRGASQALAIFIRLGSLDVSSAGALALRKVRGHRKGREGASCVDPRLFYIAPYIVPTGVMLAFGEFFDRGSLG